MAVNRRMRRLLEKGSTLVELMIAMLLLAIGLGAITSLLVTAIASDNRNNRDTTATLLAQKVIEQIGAQNVYSDTSISDTDCKGNTWPFSTTPGPVGTGNGATLKADGTIDFTQSYASVPTGYAMQYVDCSSQGGIPITYDVRWNVMNVSTNTTSRLIIASARPLASTVNQLGGLYFSLPVNLRAIGGPNIGE